MADKMERLNFEHIEGIVSVGKKQEEVQKKYDWEFAALIQNQHSEIDTLQAQYELARSNSAESKHREIGDLFLAKQEVVRVTKLKEVEELNNKYRKIVAVEKKKMQVLSDLNKSKANDNSLGMSR